MTAFLFKFSTTQTNQTPAFNRLNNEIRQGFNALYPSFGSELDRLITDQLFASPITVGLDVGDFNQQRPQDTGTMQFCYVWGEFSGVSTPGFFCDLLADLGGTTVDPIWFSDTLSNRWSRGNKTTRATTPEQRVVNGGKAEVELVDTGNNQVWLTAPEFPKHGFAGVENRPLSGTPMSSAARSPTRPANPVDDGTS